MKNTEIPKNITWYFNKDGGCLGTDILSSKK